MSQLVETLKCFCIWLVIYIIVKRVKPQVNRPIGLLQGEAGWGWLLGKAPDEAG